MQPIKDATALVAAIRAASDLVVRSPDGHLSIRRVAGWTAIPSQSAAHMGDVHRAGVLSAFGEGRRDGLLAVMLEPLREFPEAFSLPSTDEALRTFNAECGPYNVALLPADHSALVAFTTDEYFVVAGDEAFVEQALHAKPKEALARFLGFVEEPGWSTHERALLRAVHRSFAVDYPGARPGEWVHVPQLSSSGE